MRCGITEIVQTNNASAASTHMRMHLTHSPNMAKSTATTSKTQRVSTRSNKGKTKAKAPEAGSHKWHTPDRTDDGSSSVEEVPMTYCCKWKKNHIEPNEEVDDTGSQGPEIEEVNDDSTSVGSQFSKEDLESDEVW